MSVHFIGIGGIGMSALARILLQRGEAVSGSSDRGSAMTTRLEREGARIAIGHDARNVMGATRVVVSSAIAPENPELLAARAAHLPVVRRGDLLAELMNARRGIAIAGTHGKTTTTGMVACVLEAGGIDPTVLVGGERVDTGTNARSGKSDWLLSEADESDGSYLALRPEIGVVTNVENDHVSSDEELPELVRGFEQFLASIPARGLALIGLAPLGADGHGGRLEGATRALIATPRAARTRTFGFDPAASLHVRDARYRDFGSTFTAIEDGRELGRFGLCVPGEINVSDALPAIAIGRELGVPVATIAAALAEFRGVRRRFDILARTPQAIVVDDYAHHPTAVAATIEAAHLAHAGPVFVAFQAHRYTRTQYLAHDFAAALAGADAVVLTDVYAASEEPIPGVGPHSIGDPLAAAGRSVTYRSVETLPEYLCEHVPHGALVLMLGAGSITHAARRYAELLEARQAAGAAGARDAGMALSDPRSGA